VRSVWQREIDRAAFKRRQEPIHADFERANITGFGEFNQLASQFLSLTRKQALSEQGGLVLGALAVSFRISTYTFRPPTAARCFITI
jgi:hypothetical protein